MKPNAHQGTWLHLRRTVAAAIVGTATLAACGGSQAANPASNGSVAPTTSVSTASSVVLPVSDNPIVNNATAEGLKIDTVLVENNVDASGKDASDHLEIAMSNTGPADLSGFEVFYTFTDATDNTTESYYVKLPDSFTVASGGSRVAHFDNSGAPDHFAVNDFSLYATSLNALDVTVDVSAEGVAPQMATAQKDAGGAEVPD